MKDKDKTKEQLINELAELRRRISELEILEAEYKRVEEVLRESEERYRHLVALSPDTIAIHSEGKIVFINPAGVKLLKAENAEQVVGKPIMDLLHPGYRGKVKERISKAEQESTSVPFIEEKFIRLDGTTVDVEVAAVSFTYQGKPAVQAVARDITERKQAEEALRLASEIVANMAEGVVLTPVDNLLIVYANPRFEEMFGYGTEEIIGKHVTILNSPNEWSPEETAKEIIKHLERDGVWRGEVNNIKKDGTSFWCQANVTTFQHPVYGQIYVNVLEDITDRKQAEEALRESEEQLRLVTDALPVLISYVDSKQYYRFNNKAYEEWFGHPRSEITGRHVKEVLGKAVYQVIQKYFEAALSGQKVTYEGTLPYKDGGARYVIANYVPHFGEGGEVKGFFVVARDITDRKQAEEALRESEKEKSSLVEEAPIAICNVDLTGKITFVNRRFEEESGYSREEVVGKNALKLNWFPGATLKYFMQRMGARLRGEPAKHWETQFKRKDGRWIWIDQEGKVIKKLGVPVGFQIVATNITERKQAEEREKQLQQELNLSSRLASIGELAAGVAHEINNPLTGIMGFSQRLLRKSTDEKARLDLERIHNEAVRAAKVVGNLLTFARHREPKKKYLNINDILQKALELRAYELKTSNIEVVTNFAPRLPRTKVDFHQIQEVFVNIILNADQAMNEANRGGELTIKTQKLKDNIRISFTDDGPGIPHEHLDKIFDPFFTTRGRKGGTGLGLSVCHGIAERHGGRIYARSKVGKGTTFFVELPLTRVKR